MKKLTFAYEVRYENGSSNFLHAGLANSLEEAIKISHESILGCMPKEFDPDNLVRPIIARRLDICALCGSEKNPVYVPLSIGHDCQICGECEKIIRK
jgi:hypothetical protein